MTQMTKNTSTIYLYNATHNLLNIPAFSTNLRIFCAYSSKKKKLYYFSLISYPAYKNIVYEYFIRNMFIFIYLFMDTVCVEHFTDGISYWY